MMDYYSVAEKAIFEIEAVKRLFTAPVRDWLLVPAIKTAGFILKD